MSNKQPTGYNFEVKGKLVKEHECPICLMLIRNATELPCIHLMCRDCLLYYEEKELEKNKHADFRCSLCQEVYQRNESHHINVCDFLPVECPNNGCKKQMQRRKVGRHQATCEYRIVPCEHCQGEFPICLVNGHHETCLLYPVVCENSECKELVKRKQMDDHCKNECQYQVIPCIYSDVGCTIQLPRHAMETHHQEATQHHSFLLLKSHIDLSQKNRELEKHLKKSNDTIEQLQETVIKQEESIERHQAEIACLQNDVKQQKELNVKEKLTNLEMFAEQAADFFDMVRMVQFDECSKVLSQKDYNELEELKNFKHHIKEIKGKETDCQFLQTTVKAADNYHRSYFSTSYGERLKAVAYTMQKNFPLSKYDISDDTIFLMKTDSYPCNSISFNIHQEELFEEELKKNKKWNRHSASLASYYDYTEYCYYITLNADTVFEYHPCPGDVKEVWLLNNYYEPHNQEMNINDETLIDWVDHETISYFIFQIVV